MASFRFRTRVPVTPPPTLLREKPDLHRSGVGSILAAFLVAFAALLLSCSQTAGEPCQVDGDCDNGLVCDKSTSAISARGICCASRGGCVGAAPVDSGPRVDMGRDDEDMGPDEEDMGPDEEDMGPDEEDTGPRDSGPRDSGPRDSGTVDSGRRDSGPVEVDASSEDASAAEDAGDVDAG